MKNIIKSIKHSTICLLAVCLAGCAGMTDADWEALGAAAASLDKSIPSKSKSSAYRSSSSSSSSYSSNSQGTPSSSSGSSSGVSGNRYVDHVTHQCISYTLEPRTRGAPNQQWVTMTNKCGFKVEIFTKGTIHTEWGGIAEGTLHAYQTKTKYLYYDISKSSRFEYIACANKSRLGQNMFDAKAVRCINSNWD
jgi:hypothetical protein